LIHSNLFPFIRRPEILFQPDNDQNKTKVVFHVEKEKERLKVKPLAISQCGHQTDGFLSSSMPRTLQQAVQVPQVRGD